MPPLDDAARAQVERIAREAAERAAIGGVDSQQALEAVIRRVLDRTPNPGLATLLRLRIVYGVVDSAGAVVEGDGFSSSRTAAGKYTLTWSPAFSGRPAVALSSRDGFVASRDNAATYDTATVGVSTSDSPTATATDKEFSFVAVGLR